MLAGLLHYHGVWVGRSRTTMYPGTNSNFGSENLDIKHILKREAAKAGHKHWDVPFPDFGKMPELKAEIESFVPDKTPWLVKTAGCLLFWEFWVNAYPKAKWLFPTRDTLKIVDSMNRHPGFRQHPDMEKYRFISHLLQASSKVADQDVDFIYVDMEKLADRDMFTIEYLFAFLGIFPDYTIIKEWIKPEMLKR